MQDAVKSHLLTPMRDQCNTALIKIRELSTEPIASDMHSVFGATFHVENNHFIVFIMVHVTEDEFYQLYAYDGQHNSGYLQHVATMQGVRLFVVTC